MGTQYDDMGRVERQTVPCDASSCTAYWVENTYDLLGRLTGQSRPESESLSAPVTTTFAYEGRRQKITDAEGKQTIKVLDVNGWMRRSEDHDGFAQLFGYDAAGSLKSVTDTASNTLFTATYNYGIQAFQTATIDMDLGIWSYTYNSLGELVGWTDANSQSFSQTYDPLSRVTSRTEPEGTTYFSWGTSAGSKNIGRLAGVAMSGYSESFTYDSAGRPSSQTIATDQAYAIDYAYTTQGQLDTLTYPTSTDSVRVKVKYGYANGILNSVTDWTSGSAGTVYWTANVQNARGQTTQETLGNGVVTARSFDAVTGWLNTIQSGLSGGVGLQHLGYAYDRVGNVSQRQENSLGMSENFCYDNLYRLVKTELGSTPSPVCASPDLVVTYSPDGNITSRSDVNGGQSWTYHPSKKHAVATTGTGGVSFSYDANGNMTSRAGSAISWSSYNYPTGLTSGTESTTFYYGPDRQYYRQVYTGPASPTGYEETHYVGGILEKVYDGSVTDWRHYIRAEGQVVAIVSRKSTSVNAVHYPLEDNQGSGSTLVNSGGTGYVRQSYTAFGLPRDGTDWDGAVPGGDQSAIVAITRRGYTGHSMLGAMGLIHMNGRVQDAITGRFLSPDPYVFNPGFTQSFNRYSYVNNNPLSLIDPSGFCYVVNGRFECEYEVNGCSYDNVEICTWLEHWRLERELRRHCLVLLAHICGSTESDFPPFEESYQSGGGTGGSFVRRPGSSTPGSPRNTGTASTPATRPTYLPQSQTVLGSLSDGASAIGAINDGVASGLAAGGIFALPSAGRATTSWVLFNAAKRTGPLGYGADAAEAGFAAFNGDIERVAAVGIEMTSVAQATVVGAALAGPLGGILFGGFVGMTSGSTDGGRGAAKVITDYWTNPTYVPMWP